ncbi:uncharacterized protein LOC111087443 [Limulus polyphemus]|uniref:Uncharacterized protein LOC111087443 n=1 Tax=Limulus polyphemus TaxID=6850 RepID=A0ABM1T1M1_LIMPO|nr:uncharacterized protein LOC111087443 [Limulus polyphemus]
MKPKKEIHAKEEANNSSSESDYVEANSILKHMVPSSKTKKKVMFAEEADKKSSESDDVKVTFSQKETTSSASQFSKLAQAEKRKSVAVRIAPYKRDVPNSPGKQKTYSWKSKATNKKAKMEEKIANDLFFSSEDNEKNELSSKVEFTRKNHETPKKVMTQSRKFFKSPRSARKFDETKSTANISWIDMDTSYGLFTD